MTKLMSMMIALMTAAAFACTNSDFAGREGKSAKDKQTGTGTAGTATGGDAPDSGGGPDSGLPDSDSGDGPDSGAPDSGGSGSAGDTDVDGGNDTGHDGVDTTDSGTDSGNLEIDGFVESSEQPTPKWVCGQYNDALPHEIALTKGFNPSYSKGYRLYIRPGKNHCTGIAVKVKITNVDSGDSVDLQCTGTNCVSTNYRIGLNTKDYWKLPTSDLSSLKTGSIKTKYKLSFVWTENYNAPGSSCFQVNRYAYSLAFAMTRGTTAAPTEGETACQPQGTSSFDLTP